MLLVLLVEWVQAWNAAMDPYVPRKQVCRRRIINSCANLLLSSCALSDKQSCLAAQDFGDTNRPYAPLEALLPAVEFRLLLNKAVEIANATPLAEFANNSQSMENSKSESRSHIINELRKIFEEPGKTIGNRRPLQLAVKDKDSTRTSSSTGLRQLKLSGGAVRTACNSYTSNLRFGESYVLTANKSDRKRMIREDRLPGIKQVIVADLDLRDLYRNLVQTKIEDIQAEVFQEDPDFFEVRSLLTEANQAFNRWFELVRVQDILEAECLLAPLFLQTHGQIPHSS